MFQVNRNHLKFKIASPVSISDKLLRRWDPRYEDGSFFKKSLKLELLEKVLKCKSILQICILLSHNLTVFGISKIMVMYLYTDYIPHTSHRVRFFGKIRIRIFDPRSLGSWRIKGNNESTRFSKAGKFDAQILFYYHFSFSSIRSVIIQ